MKMIYELSLYHCFQNRFCAIKLQCISLVSNLSPVLDTSETTCKFLQIDWSDSCIVFAWMTTRLHLFILIFLTFVQISIVFMKFWCSWHLHHYYHTFHLLISLIGCLMHFDRKYHKCDVLAPLSTERVLCCSIKMSDWIRLLIYLTELSFERIFDMWKKY